MSLDLKIKKAIKASEKDDFHKHPLGELGIVPVNPFRSLMIGKSQSGKSNLILSLLTRTEFYKKFFDKIYLFSTTYSEDSDWKQYLKDNKEKDFVASSDLNEEVIKELMDEQKNMINKKGKRLSNQILVIFDDIITNKSLKSSIVKDLLFTGRHYLISIMISSQSYKEISRPLRMQATNIFLFRPSQDEIQRVSEENSNVFVDKKELNNLIKEATKERFSFFHINKQQSPEDWYRINLDKQIILKNEN